MTKLATSRPSADADHRFRERSAAYPFGLGVLSPFYGADDRGRPVKLRQGRRLAVGRAVGVFGVLCIWTSMMLAAWRTGTGVLLILAGGAGAAVGVPVILLLLMPRRFEALSQERRRKGLCPACLYQLRGASAEGDGCTVCPECGAAWRLAEAHDPSASSPS